MTITQNELNILKYTYFKIILSNNFLVVLLVSGSQLGGHNWTQGCREEVLRVPPFIGFQLCFGLLFI